MECGGFGIRGSAMHINFLLDIKRDRVGGERGGGRERRIPH